MAKIILNDDDHPDPTAGQVMKFVVSTMSEESARKRRGITSCPNDVQIHFFPQIEDFYN